MDPITLILTALATGAAAYESSRIFEEPVKRQEGG
jgi:hypothetical protein